MNDNERRTFILLATAFGIAVVVGFIERWMELRRMALEMEQDFLSRADEINARMQRAQIEEWR